MSVVGWLSDLLADDAEVRVTDASWGKVTIEIAITQKQLDAAYVMANAKRLAAVQPPEGGKADHE